MAVWTQLSVLLLDLLKRKSQGVQFTTPDNELRTERTADAFADDVTSWVNNGLCELQSRGTASPYTAQQIAEQLQTAAQWWAELLHASGGKLELTKYFYYILEWEFDDNGRARLKDPNALNIAIQIANPNENYQQTAIEQTSCSTAHRTMGVMLAPDGSNEAERLRLLQKSNEMARRLNSAKITSYEARTAHTVFYLPSMTYSLPATSLTRKELDGIQSKARIALTSKMGYNRNTPTAVVQAPREIGGLGIRSLYVEQGSGQGMTLLNHIRAETALGQLIRVSISWQQLISGTSYPVLEGVNEPLPHAENAKWFCSLREFLRESGCHMYIADAKGCQKQRINDRVLMDDCIQLYKNGELSAAEVEDINVCRLYAKVETLADVSNPQGTELQRGILTPEATTISATRKAG